MIEYMTGNPITIWALFAILCLVALGFLGGAIHESSKAPRNIGYSDTCPQTIGSILPDPCSPDSNN